MNTFPWLKFFKQNRFHLQVLIQSFPYSGGNILTFSNMQLYFVGFFSLKIAATSIHLAF